MNSAPCTWSPSPTLFFPSSDGFTPVEPSRPRAYVFCNKEGGIKPAVRKKTMSALLTPMLGDIYWIGGGSLGLILLIVVIVALVRR